MGAWGLGLWESGASVIRLKDFQSLTCGTTVAIYMGRGPQKWRATLGKGGAGWELGPHIFINDFKYRRMQQSRIINHALKKGEDGRLQLDTESPFFVEHRIRLHICLILGASFSRL